MGNDQSRSNEQAIDSLVDRRTIRVRTIERALRIVERHRFFPPNLPQNTNRGFMIMFPIRHAAGEFRQGALHVSGLEVYAEVLEYLRIRRGMKVLNVGSGSGFFSTVLGVLVGDFGTNHGIDIYPNLVDYGNDQIIKWMKKRIVSAVGFARPTLRLADVLDPDFWRAHSHEYDRIYVSFVVRDRNALNRIIRMLRIGGILVAPSGEQMCRYTRTSDTEAVCEFMGRTNFGSQVVIPVADRPPVPWFERFPSLQTRCRQSFRREMRRRLYPRHLVRQGNRITYRVPIGGTPRAHVNRVPGIPRLNYRRQPEPRIAPEMPQLEDIMQNFLERNHPPAENRRTTGDLLRAAWRNTRGRAMERTESIAAFADMTISSANQNQLNNMMRQIESAANLYGRRTHLVRPLDHRRPPTVTTTRLFFEQLLAWERELGIHNSVPFPTVLNDDNFDTLRRRSMRIFDRVRSLRRRMPRIQPPPANFMTRHEEREEPAERSDESEEEEVFEDAQETVEPEPGPSTSLPTEPSAAVRRDVERELNVQLALQRLRQQESFEINRVQADDERLAAQLDYEFSAIFAYDSLDEYENDSDSDEELPDRPQRRRFRPPTGNSIADHMDVVMREFREASQRDRELEAERLAREAEAAARPLELVSSDDEDEDEEEADEYSTQEPGPSTSKKPSESRKPDPASRDLLDTLKMLKVPLGETSSASKKALKKKQKKKEKKKAAKKPRPTPPGPEPQGLTTRNMFRNVIIRHEASMTPEELDAALIVREGPSRAVQPPRPRPIERLPMSQGTTIVDLLSQTFGASSSTPGSSGSSSSSSGASSTSTKPMVIVKRQIAPGPTGATPGPAVIRKRFLPPPGFSTPGPSSSNGQGSSGHSTFELERARQAAAAAEAISSTPGPSAIKKRTIAPTPTVSSLEERFNIPITTRHPSALRPTSQPRIPPLTGRNREPWTTNQRMDGVTSSSDEDRRSDGEQEVPEDDEEARAQAQAWEDLQFARPGRVGLPPMDPYQATRRHLDDVARLMRPREENVITMEQMQADFAASRAQLEQVLRDQQDASERRIREMTREMQQQPSTSTEQPGPSTSNEYELPPFDNSPGPSMTEQPTRVVHIDLGDYNPMPRLRARQERNELMRANGTAFNVLPQRPDYAFDEMMREVWGTDEEREGNRRLARDILNFEHDRNLVTEMDQERRHLWMSPADWVAQQRRLLEMANDPNVNPQELERERLRFFDWRRRIMGNRMTLRTWRQQNEINEEDSQLMMEVDRRFPDERIADPRIRAWNNTFRTQGNAIRLENRFRVDGLHEIDIDAFLQEPRHTEPEPPVDEEVHMIITFEDTVEHSDFDEDLTGDSSGSTTEYEEVEEDPNEPGPSNRVPVLRRVEGRAKNKKKKEKKKLLTPFREHEVKEMCDCASTQQRRRFAELRMRQRHSENQTHRRDIEDRNTAIVRSNMDYFARIDALDAPDPVKLYLKSMNERYIV